MKRILILIIGLIGVAYGQSAPTSAKTRFVNGLYLGTKLDAYFNAADSNAIYWRADSSLMAKYKGTARALAFAVSGGYLPISDTAAMLSKLTLDRVLANGNTSGRNLTAGNASFTTVTTNLGAQTSGDFNIPVQNELTGTLEAASPDSVRTFQKLMPLPWRYDGGSGNRLGNTAYGLYVLDSTREATLPILIGKLPDTATAQPEFQGRFNTALGASVFPIARYISDFTGIGSNIGSVMDSGFYSTLVGHNLLNKSTNGSKITSVGAFSVLEATNVVDVDNLGFEGLRYNQTGSYISNIGASGMLLNSTGNYNFSGGYQGMYQNTTGSGNTNVGALGLIDLRATSDSISQFSDYSGTVAGTVKATSVGHGRTTGQLLKISGTVNYDGTYPITVINANEFYFTDTYVADDSTGWWTLAGAEANNNTSVGYLTGGGIVSGSNNTIVGANINGLDSDLSNNIIFSDGEGNIKARHNASSWNLVDSVSALSFKVPSGTSSQFLKANGSLDNNTYLTSADISGKLNISDTSSMLSNYRRTTTKITNSDLVNSTISGISLGNNLPNLNTPYGMTGTNYNGSAFVDDWKVDTSIISTKANVTALLLPKLNLSDTATMLSNYRRKTTLIENADLRNSAITINGSSTALGGSISVGTVTSVSEGIGMSFTTITSTGAVNADTTTLATRAYVVGLDVGKANTSLNNVNGVLSSTYGGAGIINGILKANGSGVVSAAVAGTDYALPSIVSGTSGSIPKFTSSATIGNSLIAESGSTITVTGVLRSNGVGHNSTPTSLGTAQTYTHYSNTGNAFYVGNEGSSAGGFFTGSSAYAAVLYSNTPIETIVSGTKQLAVSSGTITALVPINGTSLSMSGIIASGDSYTMVGEFYYGGNLSNRKLRAFSTGTEGNGVLNYGFFNGSTWPVIYTLSANGASYSVPISGTSLSMSGGGFFGGTSMASISNPRALIIQNPAGTDFVLGIKGGTTTGNSYGPFIQAGTNSSDISLLVRDVNNVTDYLKIRGNGVSSFSENLLIKTTTDNGTDALQVAGSGLFTSSVTANSFVTTGSVRTTNPSDASYYGLFSNDGAMIFDAYGVGAFSSFKVNGTSVLSVDASGAVINGTSRANGYRFAYSAKSSNYTLTDTDDYIIVSNASTITLPTAVGRSGKRYVIRSTAGSGVSSSLTTTSSQTIDGILPFPSPFSFGFGNYNIIIVFSDGSNWFSETFITGG